MEILVVLAVAALVLLIFALLSRLLFGKETVEESAEEREWWRALK